jgi:hypothetical protein
VDQTCNFNSVLDFIFVSGVAQTWVASSQIIVTPRDFPDDATVTDHRPVVAHFEIEEATPIQPSPTKQDLLNQIAQLEQELEDLRALVEQMP